MNEIRVRHIWNQDYLRPSTLTQVQETQKTKNKTKPKQKQIELHKVHAQLKLRRKLFVNKRLVLCTLDNIQVSFQKGEKKKRWVMQSKLGQVSQSTSLRQSSVTHSSFRAWFWWLGVGHERIPLIDWRTAFLQIANRWHFTLNFLPELAVKISPECRHERGAKLIEEGLRAVKAEVPWGGAGFVAHVATAAAAIPTLLLCAINSTTSLLQVVYLFEPWSPPSSSSPLSVINSGINETTSSSSLSAF